MYDAAQAQIAFAAEARFARNSSCPSSAAAGFLVGQQAEGVAAALVGCSLKPAR